MDPAKPSENSEFWTIPAQGCEVQMVVIDFAFTLVIGDAEDRITVRVEQPFRYTDAGGKRVSLDPEGRRSDLGPALDCFGKTVDRLAVWKPDGRLELAFIDGSRIEVAHSESYEAWDVTGPGSNKFVCLPGGGEPGIWS